MTKSRPTIVISTAFTVMRWLCPICLNTLHYGVLHWRIMLRCGHRGFIWPQLASWPRWPNIADLEFSCGSTIGDMPWSTITSLKPLLHRPIRLNWRRAPWSLNWPDELSRVRRCVLVLFQRTLKRQFHHHHNHQSWSKFYICWPLRTFRLTENWRIFNFVLLSWVFGVITSSDPTRLNSMRLNSMWLNWPVHRLRRPTLVDLSSVELSRVGRWSRPYFRL